MIKCVFYNEKIDTKRRFTNFSQFKYHVIDIEMRRLRIDFYYFLFVHYVTNLNVRRNVIIVLQ